MRVRAMAAAITAAEYFRDRGRDVMLMVDSVTRSPRPSDRSGWRRANSPRPRATPRASSRCCPSCSSGAASRRRLDHRHLHRAGGGRRPDRTGRRRGEGSPGRARRPQPASRRTRSLPGHRPARIGVAARRPGVGPESRHGPAAARRAAGRAPGGEELINIGAYAQGSSPVTDVAIGLKPAIDAFLRQDRDERTDFHSPAGRLCGSRPRARDSGRRRRPDPGRPRRADHPCHDSPSSSSPFSTPGSGSRMRAPSRRGGARGGTREDRGLHPASTGFDRRVADEARDGLVGEVRPHELRSAANASMALMRVRAARSSSSRASTGDSRPLEASSPRRRRNGGRSNCCGSVARRPGGEGLSRREQADLDEIANVVGAERARAAGPVNHRRRMHDANDPDHPRFPGRRESRGDPRLHRLAAAVRATRSGPDRTGSNHLRASGRGGGGPGRGRRRGGGSRGGGERGGDESLELDPRG